MRLIFLLLFLFSCSENNTEYFPLDKIKSWSYSVEIIPEVEKKSTYKKINLSIGKRNLIVNQEKKTLFPIIKEDGSTLFYEVQKDGVYRVGKRFLKEQNINLEEKRMVLPKPVSIGESWNVNSETYLILKRYPYYDYRATTKFKLEYKVESMKEIVSTPIGVFKDCLLVVGKGETNFIGNNEIGSIEIKVSSKEWYAKNIGLIKMERVEKTDTDFFGTTKMVQVLEKYKKN